MKIHIDLPWGGRFELDCQPMELNKFYALCYVSSWALAVLLFVRIASILRG